MWIVMLACKGGYAFHSAHRDMDRANEWRECKEHDGEDAIVVDLGKEAIDEIVRVYEGE